MVGIFFTLAMIVTLTFAAVFLVIFICVWVIYARVEQTILNSRRRKEFHDQ